MNTVLQLLSVSSLLLSIFSVWQIAAKAEPQAGSEQKLPKNVRVEYIENPERSRKPLDLSVLSSGSCAFIASGDYGDLHLLGDMVQIGYSLPKDCGDAVSTFFLLDQNNSKKAFLRLVQTRLARGTLTGGLILFSYEDGSLVKPGKYKLQVRVEKAGKVLSDNISKESYEICQCLPPALLREQISSLQSKLGRHKRDSFSIMCKLVKYLRQDGQIENSEQLRKQAAAQKLEPSQSSSGGLFDSRRDFERADELAIFDYNNARAMKVAVLKELDKKPLDSWRRWEAHRRMAAFYHENGKESECIKELQYIKQTRDKGLKEARPEIFYDD